jgi:hypothetical protein
MRHSAEFQLSTWHSADFQKKFYLPLCSVPPCVKFKSKIFFPTPRNAAQWGVDSALWRIAWNCDSVLCDIVHSQHIFTNFSANSKPYANILQPVDLWPKWDWLMKNRGLKISWNCPFKIIYFWYTQIRQIRVFSHESLNNALSRLCLLILSQTSVRYTLNFNQF